MIKSLIKNIRRQPKATRDKIALGVAGLFTTAVFMIWLYHMPTKISSIAAEHQSDESSPGFSQLFKEIGGQISSVKEAISESVPEEEGATENDPQSDSGVEDWYLGDHYSSSSKTAISDVSTSTQSLNANEQYSDTSVRTVRVVATSSSTASTSPEI